METSIEFDSYDVYLGVTECCDAEIQVSRFKLSPVQLPAENPIQAFNILKLMIDQKTGGRLF